MDWAAARGCERLMSLYRRGVEECQALCGAGVTCETPDGMSYLWSRNRGGTVAE